MLTRKKIERLCTAITSDRKRLEWARSDRKENVNLFAGNHYSEECSDKSTLLNLIGLYIPIVSRNLISKNPRVLLTTFEKKSKPIVSAMQSWANSEFEKMRLDETLGRIVIDALFSIGICKVGIATPGDAANVGWNILAGQPFCERVDLDDFVFSTGARDFSSVSYIGHRFRIPLEVAQKSKLYSSYRKKLVASDDDSVNHEGDERIGVLSRGSYSGEEYEDMVDLWELYLPRERRIITLADQQVTGGFSFEDEPLRDAAYLGPYCGPYHILGYITVPGQAMPKGTVMDLVDMHKSVNNYLRKLDRQAKRMKSITAFQNAEDAARVKETNDGGMTYVGRPDLIGKLETGGPSPVLVQLSTMFKDMFSWLAGNLDIMGGLSPQSKTATQDTLLNQNSSRAIADMQDRTIHFTSKVIESMCWYWWHHPQQMMKTQYSVPGVPDISLTREVSPLDRASASFEEMDIKVDPYSMVHQTPQSRLQALNEVIKGIFIPLAQIAAQQGVTLDLNAYLAKAAQYLDQPDITEILTVQEPPMEKAGSRAGPGPAETERTYNRTNMPGRTRQGDDMNLMNSMMGIDQGGSPEGNGFTPMNN